MTEIPLTGLAGSHPMAAMAAFGLLRVAGELAGTLGETRLAWQRRGEWRAVLHCQQAIHGEELIDRLVSHQQERAAAPELQWADDIKVPLERFAREAREAAAAATPSDRRRADFLAAYGSDLVRAKSKPEVKPTAFHMTAGQQRFLKQARELAAGLAPGVGQAQRAAAAASLHEALFGPWSYQDRQHSFGWDPAAERLHALSARSPTAEDPLGVRAAVWLAFEALPLFPTAAVGERLQTTGFDPESTAFAWPVWEAPLSLAVVRSLLALVQVESVEQLRARGVAAVFQSQRAVSDRGYGSFRTAVLRLAQRVGRTAAG